MNTRCLLVLAFLSITFLTPAFAPQASAGEPRTPTTQSLRWSDDLDLLATQRERDLFSGLRGEAERRMFFQAFWQARDPYPQTGRNELREEWEGRLAQVRSQWKTLRDDRARAYLLRGEPSSRFEAKCPSSGVFEVWVYEPGFREKHRTVLVFLPGSGGGGDGNARLWHPGTAPDIAAAATEPCSNRERLSQEAKLIHWAGKDHYEALVQRALARPKPREWVSTFRPVSLDVPEDAPRLDAGLEIEYAGLQWNKVVVRVLMLVSPRSLQASAPSGVDAHEFSVAGQVLRNGEPIESFLYRLRGRPIGQGVPLAFERYLAPGRYTLRVRLEHLASGSVLIDDRDIEVPQLQTASLPDPVAPAPLEVMPARLETLKISSAPPQPAPIPPDITRALAEADAALSSRRPGLRLLSPPGAVLTGHARFGVRLEQAAERGGIPAPERIERVAWFLDGKPLLTRNNPPFDLSIDLGEVPRPRKLRAEGLGGDGSVLARDEMLVNAGAQSFRVRLLEPRPGRNYQHSLRALVDVTPPTGAAVEKVEIWFGEELLATLHQPPYAHPLLLPNVGEAGYVRAVAWLAGGGTAEDLVFINTPATPESMDVHLVELYTTVLDGQGRPVTGGLDPGAFQVTENGVRQTIRQVDQVGDTPVRLVTLIDSSASMAPQMKSARQAAHDFLQSLLRPRDQAAVIAFNRHPQVVVPLTGDLERLDEGLQGMLAEDDTALYDSLVYSLLYLTEAKGQRAVLLLSDGLDRSSRLGFDQALEAARRSGIAVYAIGLGLPNGAEGEAGQRLTQLAGVTGGRTFFADDAAQLAGVYAEIERELRAQYKISYQSSNTEADGGFRKVQVRLAKGGLEARTISGYYP